MSEYKTIDELITLLAKSDPIAKPVVELTKEWWSQYYSKSDELPKFNITADKAFMLNVEALDLIDYINDGLVNAGLDIHGRLIALYATQAIEILVKTTPQATDKSE